MKALVQRSGSLLAGALLGASLMLAGLVQADKLRPPRAELLVSVAQLVEIEHEKADLLLARNQVAEAIAALEIARSRTRDSWPSREQAGDEALVLRHDLYGRLLRLRLDHPEIDSRPIPELLQIAEEGLGTDWNEVPANPFTARLLAIRGELLGQLGRDDEALGSLEQALEQNRVLLDQAMAKDAK